MYQQMKWLGKWGRNHMYQAQLIIVLCYALLFALYHFYGQVLQGGDIKIPKALVYVCLTVAAVVYTVHELVHRHVFIGNRFVFLKLSCMVILSFSFFGLLVVSTQPAGTFPLYQVKSYAAYPVPKKSGMANASGILSHEVKQTNKPSIGGQIALIALVILLSALLELVIAALSCSIACSGNSFLAVAVLVFGTSGVAVLAVYLIRNILGRPKHRNRWQN